MNLTDAACKPVEVRVNLSSGSEDEGEDSEDEYQSEFPDDLLGTAHCDYCTLTSLPQKPFQSSKVRGYLYLQVSWK